MADDAKKPKIEHVVVLMMENRSFDHVLGYLEHPDAKFNGLRTGSYFNVAGEGATRVEVPVSDDGTPYGSAPDHSHAGILVQMGAYDSVADNGGFVSNYAQAKGTDAGPLVMRCLAPSLSPVLSTLATEFAVCDHWFSSVPGETWPNRNFAHAATSDGETNIAIGFYKDKTIFEQLDRAKRTWHIYHDGPAQVWCFKKLWKRNALIELIQRKNRIGNWYVQDAFYEHVRDNKLPDYSFIEPAHMPYLQEENDVQTNSQHPENNVDKPDDYYRGEALIKSIYDALVANPELFATTLFVITYDEHGGFYDHEPPPTAPPPGDRILRGVTRRIGSFVRGVVDRRNHRPQTERYDFGRCGVRVPAVLVSPWIEPGTLYDKRLEHASIPKTVRALFAPDAPPLTKRDGAPDELVGTFHDVVERAGFAEPRLRGGGAFPLPVLHEYDEQADGPAPPRLAAPDPVSTTPVTGVEPSHFEVQMATLNAKVEDKLSSPSLRPGSLRRMYTRRRDGEPTTSHHEGATAAQTAFAATASEARSSR